MRQVTDGLEPFGSASQIYEGFGWQPIFRANEHVISDPDLIHPGMVAGDSGRLPIQPWRRGLRQSRRRRSDEISAVGHRLRALPGDQFDLSGLAWQSAEAFGS